MDLKIGKKQTNSYNYVEEFPISVSVYGMATIEDIVSERQLLDMYRKIGKALKI